MAWGVGESPAGAPAANKPASDGKPAGDTQRGESIVQESAAEQKQQATAKDNPGWQNAQRGNEEKK